MNHMRAQYGFGYEEPTGQAVLTEGYNLPSRYVIHTVGPIVGGSFSKRRSGKDCGGDSDRIPEET
nr:macro domain-containing protein [uncultured Merdimonas sp.]